MKWSRILLLFSFVLGLAQAVEVSDLYTARVIVASRDPALRPAAFTEALEQICVKLSGQALTDHQRHFIQSITNPEQAVQSFRYQDLAVKVAGRVEKQQALEIQFHEKAIDDMARGMKLPVWPANRPLTMLWLTVEGPYGQQLLGAEADPDLMQTLQSLAKTWGVPVVIPLLDLTDVAAIKPETLWQLSREAITEASARYGSDAILVGRIKAPTERQWQASWTLLANGQDNVWNTQSDTFSGLLQSGLEGLASRLSSQLSLTVTETKIEEIPIIITGIQSYTQYTALLHYLRQLPQVQQLRVMQFEMDNLSLLVTTTHAPAFNKALLVDRHLIRDDSVGAEVKYRFIP